MSPLDFNVRVTCPPPARRYRGRRARRDAFYARQKFARVLQRFVNIESVEWSGSLDEAHRDMLVQGFGAVEFVADPHPWPSPIYRVRHVSEAEFRREYQGKWTDDFTRADGSVGTQYP